MHVIRHESPINHRHRDIRHGRPFADGGVVHAAVLGRAAYEQSNRAVMSLRRLASRRRARASDVRSRHVAGGDRS